MAIWQQNLSRLLEQKAALILHGNIRDSGYIKKDGALILGLSTFIRELGKSQNFQRVLSWGVFFDHDNIGCPPNWSLERMENLMPNSKWEARKSDGQEREVQVLTRWLAKEISDESQRTLFVIHYIDKLTPFSKSGAYSREVGQIVLLVQKIIQNISANNRLIMIALQDSMVPLEYYTHSPRVSVFSIPLPDCEERTAFFSSQLGRTGLTADQFTFLGNITDGLYVRDLENILQGVLLAGKDFSQTSLRKIVNRYRIGSEEDPWAKLPLSGPPKGLIDSAETWFKQRIIGQDHAVVAVTQAIKSARAGIASIGTEGTSKPKAIFFFAGPTGVGKTFLAKKLSDYLFDSEQAFVRFDMSEFKEEHTVSKLIGAPPGYVGFEAGGELTNAVKNRPFSVVLFDEIEKAHPKIMDIFLQMLDDGRLTDNRGQTIFFTESVIIFTSNLGTRTNDSRGGNCPEKARLDDLLSSRESLEDQQQKIREHFIDSVNNYFTYEISRPELLNRIGSQIIAFNYVRNADDIRQMIDTKLNDVAKGFRDKFAEQHYSLEIDPKVADFFSHKHSESISKYGGRGLVNAIKDEISGVLAAQLLLAEKNSEIDKVFILEPKSNGELQCRRQ